MKKPRKPQKSNRTQIYSVILQKWSTHWTVLQLLPVNKNPAGTSMMLYRSLVIHPGSIGSKTPDLMNINISRTLKHIVLIQHTKNHHQKQHPFLSSSKSHLSPSSGDLIEDAFHHQVSHLLGRLPGLHCHRSTHPPACWRGRRLQLRSQQH